MLRFTRRLTPAVNEGILITVVAVYVCFNPGFYFFVFVILCVARS